MEQDHELKEFVQNEDRTSKVKNSYCKTENFDYHLKIRHVGTTNY